MAYPLNVSIARSLEADERLLPHFSELFADIWALDADPDAVASLLEPLLPEAARVLDLACCKGAVSVALAAELGCHTVGLDGLPAFVEAAEVMSQKYKVEHLCRFASCDIRDYSPEPNHFDAVLLGAASPIWDSPYECVAALRSMVKPGGLLVLDDLCLVPPARLPLERHSVRPTRETAIEALTAFGDVVVHEEIMPMEYRRAVNEINDARIQWRAATLARRHHDLAALFCAFVSRRMNRRHALETGPPCTTWVLRSRQ